MSSQPSKIGRLLADGTTQLFQNEFNKIGNVTKTIDPLGRETRYLYDTNLIDLLSVRRKKGSSTELLDSSTYNSMHLPLTIRNASGQLTTFTYNSKGQVLTYVNPKGEATAWTYDSSGYLLKRQGPLSGDSTKYSYDGYGRVRTISGPDGHMLRLDYDALDRTTKISYPDSTYEQLVYQNLDLEKSRDRLGRWSKTFHNALQQPVAYQDPLQHITNFEWCGCGSIKSLTDPEGRKIEWKRDLQGRVTEKIGADGKKYQNSYDSASGRLLSQTDPKEQVTEFKYFKDDAVEQVSYANVEHSTSTVSYSYDTVYNRLSTMTDSFGTTQYKYKPVGSLGALQLDTLDGPWSNDVIAYTYDSLGRVMTRSINGVRASKGYDNLGRITSDSNALGAFTYRYLGQTSRLDSMVYPNGQKTLFSYFNNAGDFRLQEIKNLNPASAQISKFNYTYDPGGQIRSWARRFDAQDSTTFDFVNDATDQLTAATLKNATSGNILKSYSYSYDKAGNRQSDQEDSITHQYAYNSLNELLTSQGGGKIRFMGRLNEPGTLTINGSAVPVGSDTAFSALVGVTTDTNIVTTIARDFSNNVDTNRYRVVVSHAGSTTYTYDANGNLISDGIHGFEYDAQDRLIAVVNGTLRSEFLYDGYDRRVQIVEKSSGAVTSKKRFLWAANVIAEERDSTGGTVMKRFFAQGGKLGSAKYFYTKDHLGSLREITDSAGALVVRYDYDPYGTRVRLFGSADADFGFTGHYFHAPSGLYLTKYRAYDSKIGRWTTKDPIGFAGGLNHYAYVFNNPVNLIDPLGLDAGACGYDANDPNVPARTPVNQGTGRAPKSGPPNSIYEQTSEDGNTVRSRTYYDENGNNFTRQDYDHPHGPYDEHEHTRFYDKAGRPISGKQTTELPEGYPNTPTRLPDMPPAIPEVPEMPLPEIFLP